MLSTSLCFMGINNNRCKLGEAQQTCILLSTFWQFRKQGGLNYRWLLYYIILLYYIMIYYIIFCYVKPLELDMISEPFRSSVPVGITFCLPDESFSLNQVNPTQVCVLNNREASLQQVHTNKSLLLPSLRIRIGIGFGRPCDSQHTN